MNISFLRKKTNNIYEDSMNRKHKGDSSILIYSGLLILFGLVVIYAIGPARANVLNHAYGSDYSSDYFFIKQLLSIILSVLVFFAMFKIDYRFWLKNAQKLLLVGLGLCVLLAISSYANLPFTQCSLGACRWFDLGPLGTFQPAEFLKFAIVFFLAQFMTAKINAGKIDNRSETLYPILTLLFITALLIIGVQTDLGTGASLIAIFLSVIIISGIKTKTILQGLVGLIIFIIIFVITSPHRIERMSTFFMGDNTSTTDASSYHIEHAKIALGSGGFSGVGIGNSVQATGYLPEAINDSVFAIIGEMFGFVGTSILAIIFFGFLYRIIIIMNGLQDMKVKLIAAGIFGWISAHVIFNIFSMLGLAPLTGITLPLLSFGGTSLIFVSAIIGLLYQISCYTSHSNIKELKNENSSSGRGIGRTRYSSHRGYTRD